MADRAVYLRLTPQQVGDVIRKASSDVSAASGLDWEPPSPTVLEERFGQADRTQFSMMFAMGLLILARLIDGELVRVADMAAELQMDPSPMHRLIYTLQTLGLVEYDPKTDRYRISR
jgi:IclR helix-turn-helix domain